MPKAVRKARRRNVGHRRTTGARLPSADLHKMDAYAKQAIRDVLIEHKQYSQEHGDDRPDISGWRWGQAAPAASRGSTEADNI